jgi:sulfite reductase alpha subunit-like flavoprotein
LCLDKLPAGSSHFIPCGLTNGSFYFPADKETPMIMTGLGTGLAPFRAFIQEWSWHQAHGTKTGPMWLFYGCRHEKKDYIFGEELKQYHADGVLTELRPAFSRDQKEKIYVQNRMEEAADQLHGDLVAKNGYFYLCGQAGQLEIDVENAIKKAVKHSTSMSDEEAQKFVDDMHENGRYNLELY